MAKRMSRTLLSVETLGERLAPSGFGHLLEPDGIKGETVEKGMKREITMESFSFGPARGQAAAPASPAPASPAQAGLAGMAAGCAAGIQLGTGPVSIGNAAIAGALAGALSGQCVSPR